jgi:hypothetical protein
MQPKLTRFNRARRVIAAAKISSAIFRQGRHSYSA